MLSSSHSQVVRDKRTGKTRGFGFVSFSNPSDLAAALKEMNGITSNRSFTWFYRLPHFQICFLGSMHNINVIGAAKLIVIFCCQ